MKISLVVPNRNNLKYFKWSYDSIRKHQGNHIVYICSAADACNDGTVEYYKELTEQDPYFKYIVNDGPERLGHTILYDRIVNELVETEIAMIWHCDMYLCPNALDEVEQLMYSVVHTDHVEGGFEYVPKYKTIVSLTRIEPPLHPDGPEKYLADWGIEPEDFNEDKFLSWFSSGYNPKHNPPYTEGVFAPWAFFKKDFIEIGGHDRLFVPQSKEDSLTGDSPIFYIENNTIRLSTIESLWDKYSDNVEVRDDGKELINTSKLKVSVLAPTMNGHIGSTNMKGLIRHKVNTNDIRRLETKWGTVKVTTHHSLINSVLEAITVNDLSSETKLWKPTTLGRTTRGFIKEIDFNKISDVAPPFPMEVINNITEYGTDDKLHAICEFLGFFTADGGAYASIVKISEKDIELAKYIKQKSEVLFLQDVFTDYRCDPHSTHNTDVHVYYTHCADLSRWFTSLFGGSCQSKKIPDVIFNLPIVYQQSFLYGYLLGDGHLGRSIIKGTATEWVSVDKRLFFVKEVFNMFRWMSTSKSPILTTGIYYLLYRCFPNNQFRIDFSESKQVWNISSLSTDFKGEKIKVTPYISDDTETYVYDLEVRNHKFIGGVGFIGLHNSDIFNRLQLNRGNFIQTWNGCVYHMTCRGSRFNPTLTTVGKNSDEWEKCNFKSMRNFIRKWGSPPMHDTLMKPIIPPKYHTAIMCTHLTENALFNIEIWGDVICSTNSKDIFSSYTSKNQSLTDYNLMEKLVDSIDEKSFDVIIYIDCNRFNNTDMQYLSVMSQMIAEVPQFPAEYEIGNMTVKINSKENRVSTLIFNTK